MKSDDIRGVRSSDADALVPLFEQLGYPTPAEEIRRRIDLLGHDRAVLVAEDADALAGFIAIELQRDFVDGDRAKILGLVVAEGLRGVGTGARLLAAAQAWALDRGARAMSVSTNVIRERAHRFYEREGYARVKSQHVFRKECR